MHHKINVRHKINMLVAATVTFHAVQECQDCIFVVAAMVTLAATSPGVWKAAKK
jgi:hypothetical protein